MQRAQHPPADGDAAVTGMRGVDVKVGGCAAGEGGLCPTDHGEVGMLPHRLQQTVPPKQKPLLVERNFLGQLQNLNKNAMLKNNNNNKKNWFANQPAQSPLSLPSTQATKYLESNKAMTV